MGYLTYGTDAANMLFHVVNERHRRRRSMIFTTNKTLAAWGRVLHDEDLAQAIVDRVLERGRLLTLDGPSMRTRHLGLDDISLGTSNHGGDKLARISGTYMATCAHHGRHSPSLPAIHMRQLSGWLSSHRTPCSSQS